MNPGSIRKCQVCHGARPRELMAIFTAPGLSLRVCRECYVKLVDKYLGYAQTQMEFVKQMPRTEEDLPF